MVLDRESGAPGLFAWTWNSRLPRTISLRESFTTRSFTQRYVRWQLNLRESVLS